MRFDDTNPAKEKADFEKVSYQLIFSDEDEQAYSDKCLYVFADVSLPLSQYTYTVIEYFFR